MVLLLHKLLLKVLPVTTFHVSFIFCIIVPVFTCVLVVFLFIIVTNLASWLQDLDKLTYLHT